MFALETCSPVSRRIIIAAPLSSVTMNAAQAQATIVSVKVIPRGEKQEAEICFIVRPPIYNVTDSAVKIMRSFLIFK
jgi:hypothetical protein